MNSKIIWKTPEESINGKSRFSLIDDGKITLLKMEFEGKKAEIKFSNTMCYKHTCINFSDDFIKMPECYEALIELEKSDWLLQIEESHKEDFFLWELKHYAILNENDGLFQFIAEGYSISEA